MTPGIFNIPTNSTRSTDNTYLGYSLYFLQHTQLVLLFRESNQAIIPYIGGKQIYDASVKLLIVTDNFFRPQKRQILTVRYAIVRIFISRKNMRPQYFHSRVFPSYKPHDRS